ncbi:hypothetical protein Tco_0114969 [Tanacetum coccineum]
MEHSEQRCHISIAYLGREKGSEDFTDILSTIDHSPLSPKAGSWNQFPSSIATALICLSTAMDAADEENVLAHADAGSPAAEAHPVPHPPPFSPVREPTPERLPETEWVVPFLFAYYDGDHGLCSSPSPILGSKLSLASPPTPPAQTLRFEEPLWNHFGGFHVETHAGPDVLLHQQPILLTGTARLVVCSATARGCVIQDAVDLKAYHVWASEALDVRTEFYIRPVAQFHAPRSTEFFYGISLKFAGRMLVLIRARLLMLDLEIPAEFLQRMSGQATPRGRNRQCALWQSYAEDLPRQTARVSDSVRRRLEKDRLLSAQYNLFRPNLLKDNGLNFSSAGSTPMSGSAVPDTAGGPLDTTGTASNIPTSAAMDSAASHHELGISPFADSDDSSSPSPVSTDHVPIDVLVEPTPGGIHAFFLDSDEDEQIGLSRVAAEPDSDDEVLAEISLSAVSRFWCCVVVVDTLPDDEIVDPRVKVEPISESPSSPPRGESRVMMILEEYIPPIPYGAFKDWEIVRCPLRNTYYHVYYQENRRHRNFFYLKELLPHVYREDLLLLRRRMNRYFRLNPDVDVGLDLWRDVNLLCQSLHSDDVEDFWRTQDEWVVSGWRLYPKSSVHVLDLTNGKTQFDPTKPLEDDYMNRVTRSNGNMRFFRTLMGVLSIFDREDLKAVYELVMEEYHDEIPEGYPLTKEVLSQLLDLKLETEEESTMALELIKFVKQQLEEFEDSNDDDTVTSTHEDEERV